MLPVAILAGGLATRLRPITETIPKALVEVAGRPFLAWQLEDLARQGVERVVLCTGYRGEQIEAEIGAGEAFGLKVAYSPDGPKLLGTGGALKKAAPMLGDTFFVLYGDSFLPCDFAAVQQAFEASGKPALMTVLENAGRWDASNVLFCGGQLVSYNKRNPHPDVRHIDYGLGVVRSQVLNAYPDGEAFDLAEVYQKLSEAGELAGFEVEERFYEIGSHEGLRETEEFFTTRARTGGFQERGTH